jgi:uncharacterized protein YecA (UPF0149 family)
MNYKEFSKDELIQELEIAGRTPNLDLIRACLHRVDELESALLDLLRIDPWKEYAIEDETDPLAYGDVHAGHLLIAVRSQAALPVIDKIFRDPDREHLIEWFGMKLHHYGSVALPLFTNLLLDEDAFSYGRSTAAAILTQIAYNEPEQTPLVVATLQKLLPPLPEGNAPIVGDDQFDEMWTWAILELSNLGDEESQAQIEALYAADAVESWIIGDYDDYMKRLQDKRTDLPDPYDIIQTYESLQHYAASEAEQAAKWEKVEQQKLRLEAMLDKQEQRAAARAATRGERPSQLYEQEAPGEPSIRKIPKVGRNAPCPCGSGKKYKKCHGRPGG